MGRSFPIPKGYVSMAAALRRAALKWGADGDSHLCGLLVRNDLVAHMSARDGQITEIPAELWKDQAKTMRAISLDQIWPDDNIPRSYDRNNLERHSIGRPVFDEKILGDVLPTKTSHAKPVSPDPEQQILPQGDGDSEKTGRSRGRPPNIDNGYFWAHATLLWAKGLQGTGDQSLKEFVDAMDKWATTEKGMLRPYSRETIEKYLGPYCEYLRINSKNFNLSD